MNWRFWSRNSEQELERELRAHLDLEAEEQGDLDAARRALGNLTQIKEEVREIGGWTIIDRFRQDLKYSLRQIRRTPGFTAVAVLTLALGLGTTTAMFSVVNGVLLEPLKYRDPGRLFLARTVPPPQAKLARDFPVNARQFERWRVYCGGCERMALAQFLELTLAGVGDPVKLPGLSVTSEFFRTLGARPALGRDFLPDDDPGRIIIADSLWRSRFAADPSIVGRKIELNGENNYIVIGVMPSDLHLPKGDEWGGFSGPAQAPVIFRPVGRITSALRIVGNLNYSALIRLKPGVSREQGIAELNALLADVYREYKLETRTTLIPLQQQVTRDARSALWLLFVTVGVVLLIVCVNVGNLMLVRTSGRYREAGVRLALGASRARLFALVLEEALVVVTIGGACGLAIAFAGLKLLAANVSAIVPRMEDVRIDLRVLLFGGAAIILSTIICGFIPAWRLSRTEPMESMKAGSASSTEGRGKLRLREAMVSVEVALSTVLLMIGGLLLISLYQVLRMSFVVRTRVDPSAITGAIRALLSREDPEMALPPPQTMEQIVEDSVASRRFEMYLAVVFAVAALLLASLGIYGVISFSVARRTPEIGIRIALGARASELAAMILREGMIPVLIGLIAGLVTAEVGGRIISSQLYGVTPNDPLTIIGVSIILLSIASCACWFPARRATRVDPLVALRFE